MNIDPNVLNECGIQPGDDLNSVKSRLCTDVSAARIFCSMFGALVKWCDGLGWLVWDGARWASDSHKVYQAAVEVGPAYRALCASFKDAKIAEAVFTWAKRCESTRGIEDILERVKHVPVICTPADVFDREPFLVNCRNLLLDFRGVPKGAAVPLFSVAGSAANLTRVIPHDWIMEARRVTWDRFLAEIFPDGTARAYVKRAVGYSLLGTTREQCLFICHGGGANGKSVFLNAIMHAFGPDYACQVDPGTFTSRQHGIRCDLAMLKGVRFIVATETNAGAKLDSALVKQATGGDPIVCRKLYQEPFSFTPTFKLWLCTNHKPVITDPSHAMWRRIRFIPFEVTIPPERQDRDLPEKLRQEAEGIIAWAVEGALEYVQDGLQAPGAVRVATGCLSGRTGSPGSVHRGLSTVQPSCYRI